MTNRDITSQLCNWLTAILGVPAIKSHMGADRPPLPYVMVNLLRFDTVRDHEQIIEFEGGEHAPSDVPPYPPITAAPVIEGEWDFSLHAYTENPNDPTDILMPLQPASKLPQIMEPLFPNMVISDISQIRRLPEFINNEWEMRAQVDFSLRGLTRYGFEVDAIEEAQINVEREI